LIFLGIFKEIYKLLNLLLCCIHACNMLELSLDLFICTIDLDIRFSHAKNISHATFTTERATSLRSSTFIYSFTTRTTASLAVHASVNLEKEQCEETSNQNIDHRIGLISTFCRIFHRHKVIGQATHFSLSQI